MIQSTLSQIRGGRRARRSQRMPISPREPCSGPRLRRPECCAPGLSAKACGPVVQERGTGISFQLGDRHTYGRLRDPHLLAGPGGVAFLATFSKTSNCLSVIAISPLITTTDVFDKNFEFLFIVSSPYISQSLSVGGGIKVSNLRKGLFVACMAACMIPEVSTAAALVGGILFSLLLGNPFAGKSAHWSKVVLQLSVVGLGFGLSLGQIVAAGKASLLLTTTGISLTLLLGYILGRMYGVGGNTSALISFGTAICGGSAIAAMAPVLKARDHEIAVAMATVFMLNSIALLLFPFLGHLMHLNQELFGTWAGLAIHDTSSVVGAAASYGSQALAVGTTVKLSRAIWITPVVVAASSIKGSTGKAAVPLFIIGFVLAAATRSLLPQYKELFQEASSVSRQALVVALFLVGAGLSIDVLKQVGLRPLLQGVTLWLLVSGATLSALLLMGVR